MNFVAAAILLLLWPMPAGATGTTTIDQLVALEIRAAVEPHGAAAAAGDLQRLYEPFGYEPLWHLDAAREERGKLVGQALLEAGEHGFVAADLLVGPAPLGDPAPRSIAERDILLSEAFLRYSTRLRQGSVLPSASADLWEIPADPFDRIGALVQAIRADALPQLLASLRPPDIGYGRLLDALRRHRRLVSEGGWPVLSGVGELKLDGADPRLPVLRDRLRVEGDLETGESAGTPAALLAAVRRFQERHGLDTDGRVGLLTLRELAVTADQRLAQIEVNLERWRWLPHQPGETYVSVNVAAAALTLIQDGVPGQSIRVIVGDEKHPTPSFAAKLVAVTLNPPWNVPTTIATREILPKLRRNPRYLAANDIVILGRSDDPFGLSVDWRALPARRFPFLLQQRPGPRNSLGAIKFEMPNRFDVYLHDTPGKHLFARSDRALSHGCIRIERPLDLAAALLGDSAWSVQALEAATARAETRRVSLARPIPVYLVYFTAFVGNDGRVNFRHDLYGRDARIERALTPKLQPGSANTLDPEPGGCREPKRLVEGTKIG